MNKLKSFSDVVATVLECAAIFLNARTMAQSQGVTTIEYVALATCVMLEADSFLNDEKARLARRKEERNAKNRN